MAPAAAALLPLFWHHDDVAEGKRAKANVCNLDYIHDDVCAHIILCVCQCAQRSKTTQIT